jgi:hypothetical protein
MPITLTQGTPDFSVFEASDCIEASAQLVFETIWINDGGPGTGIVIAFWGPALEEGFVRIRSVDVGTTHHVIEGAAPTPVVCIELASWAIAPAIDGEPSAENMSEFVAAFGRSQVVVNVAGDVLRRGKTQLVMSVTPVGAELGDACELALELEPAR